MKNDGTYGPIDSLTITYDGNRLVKVTDNAEALNYNGALDFHDGENANCEYAYVRPWGEIQYTSFHKVSRIGNGANIMELIYGPDKSRRKITRSGNGSPETKFYVGALYEQSSGSVLVKTCYIFAGDKAVAIYETKGNTTNMLYLHHDHLGSITAYSDNSGAMVQELSYDAWGRRRDPSTWECYNYATDAEATNPWGFTGHEHIDIFDMVNMDGRMYDPMTGRFLSPDPFMQAPDYTQGLNRYAYCLNNPLSLTNPTGYNWWSDNWKSLLATAVGITVAALTAGTASSASAAIIAGAAGGAAGALTGAVLNGANIDQVAKATLTGAFWGGVSGFFNFASADELLLAKIYKHTFSQGWLEGIQGGNMFHGMMMGAVSGVGGHYIDKYHDTLGKVGETTASAVLGGTIDELGGGKFANGAITSAYSVMFNDMMHPQSEDEYVPQIVERGGIYYMEGTDGQLYIMGEKPLETYPIEFAILFAVRGWINGAISSCISYFNNETGGINQWIRVGPSYSRTGHFRTKKSIKWGAGKGYVNTIGNEKLRGLNIHIRQSKLPGNNWRVNDPGHFHIQKE